MKCNQKNKSKKNDIFVNSKNILITENFCVFKLNTITKRLVM